MANSDHRLQSTMLSESRGLSMPAYLPVLVCVLSFGSIHCSQKREESTQIAMRLNALESGVEQLRISAAAMRITIDALKREEKEVQAGRDFSIRCLASWDELSSMGQALWGCRTAKPMENGFYPNCNVTSSKLKNDMTAKEYFDTTMKQSTILSHAQLIGRRDMTLNHHPAVEAEFEHAFLGQPLRMLSAVVLTAGRAFTVTCSSPKEGYKTLLPSFRSIMDSFEVRI